MRRARLSRRTWIFMPALLAGLWLAGGCSSLCTKHLYLYRDTEKKLVPASNLALLITDPYLAGGVVPAPRGYLEAGCPWEQDDVAAGSETYRLSMDAFDGKPVYQGLCLDTTPTYAVEVQPGSREARLRLELFSPGGHERFRETPRLNLEAGRVYFLRPDCEALKNRRFVLKVEPLPEPYTPELRARLITWKRQHVKGKFMED